VDLTSASMKKLRPSVVIGDNRSRLRLKDYAEASRRCEGTEIFGLAWCSDSAKASSFASSFANAIEDGQATEDKSPDPCLRHSRAGRSADDFLF